MRDRVQWSAESSDWQLAFDGGRMALVADHGASGVHVEGVLGFCRSADDGEQCWQITGPRDDTDGRLALVDSGNNVQGYLVVDLEGDRWHLTAIHRAAQAYRGVFTFEGTASLGEASFACRTRAPRKSDVVQMASGPVDSLLNDSIFDVETDTALRFHGSSVQVAGGSGASGGNRAFPVKLAARIDDPAQSSVGVVLIEDYYRSRYVPHYRPLNKQRCPSPPTGWMSWNVYFDRAGEEENLAEARFAEKHLKPYGLDIWSIESWQPNSDTLPVRAFHNLCLEGHPEQFPHGMRWLADQIRELGFKPGIWTAPFGTGNSEFYTRHRKWFLHDSEGKPMTNWCGNYLLDPTQDEVLEYMHEMHRHMAEEWGYEFFKIDGMSGRSHGYSAHFFERPEVQEACENPTPDAFSHCVAAFREGIGEDAIFLACQGHYSGPDVAYADAGRIGGDIVSPNQPSKWHNVLSQANATLNQLFVHNIVWYGDPDTLLVGTTHDLSAARVTATVVALPGQLMFAGDKLAELPDERLRMIQQALPVCDVRPLDLFPIFGLKPIWDLKISRPFGAWDVVSVFNWAGDDTRAATVTFGELGLPESDSYLVFDFWNDRLLGTFEEQFECEIEPRGTQLFAIHPALERPQFLSTDRHITQGAVSVCQLSWDDQLNSLSGTSQLVEGDRSVLVFRVPAGFRLAGAKAEEGIDVSVQDDGAVVRLTLVSESSREGDWVLEFDAQPGE
ncbi:MAG: hypothetical protein HN742_33920 [Lentisphaerae bacterium]|jgi:hypothetical protein|nr:hypothetical protein [Lentisphaerota bacterium]MBT4815694.1 hypothetical protein [Lentisphaerota bacterium]MBT5611462.1 hypothetical protein [Lentisphaerota bacterium]MBT7061011.1 hypothetical protein [Lentisphaerota bacterium]MBT7846919.1 hypothetical protein [Lentisphaerota bacterium]